MSEDTDGARGDTPHEETELIGAWLLGGLGADESARLQAHLATCPECRAEAGALRGVVARLREVDPDEVRPVGVTPPASLDARIAEVLSGGEPAVPAATPLAPRRRPWLAAVGGLVVGAAAASLLVATTTGDPSDPPPAAAPVVVVDDVRSSSGVTASAGYVDHTWGVEIQLKARGLPSGEAFAVEVVDDRGTTHDAGAFIGVAADRTIDCEVNASVLSARADHFVVTGPSGATMIEGDLSS